MTAGSTGRPPGRAGCLITFEGVEGSGKTTQVERLAAGLRRSGVEPLVTKEPGGTELGRQLRGLLLAESAAPLTAVAELLLYAADRAQHIEELIEPVLRRGGVVLCDRFLDASLAYQGYGRGLGVQRVLDLHLDPPLDRRPDRTVLLEIDPQRGIARARERNERLGLGQIEGRFEGQALEFHRRVREGYLALAAQQPARFRVIAADAAIEEVHLKVVEAVRDLLPELESVP